MKKLFFTIAVMLAVTAFMGSDAGAQLQQQTGASYTCSDSGGGATTCTCSGAADCVNMCKTVDCTGKCTGSGCNVTLKTTSKLKKLWTIKK